MSKSVCEEAPRSLWCSSLSYSLILAVKQRKKNYLHLVDNIDLSTYMLANPHKVVQTKHTYTHTRIIHTVSAVSPSGKG